MLIRETIRHSGAKNFNDFQYQNDLIRHNKYIKNIAEELFEHIKQVLTQGTVDEIISEVPQIVGECVDLIDEALN